MAHWNEGYSRKMQRKMQANSQQKIKPLYIPYQYSEYNDNTSRLFRIQQREKEKKFWVFGGIIIGIVFIAGVWAVIWAATM